MVDVGVIRSPFVWVFCALVASGCGFSGSKSEVLKRPTPARPSYGDPAWSPDGRFVGFDHRPLRSISKNPETGEYVYDFNDSLHGFWIISSSGGPMKRLGSSLSSPAWSRDGHWIAYENSGQIWKVSVTNDTIIGTGVQVSSDQFGGLFPAWSPDGNRLLYSITSGPGAGLRMVNADGTQTHPIGQHGWIYPDWRSDGERILFLGQVGASYGLGTCDTTGLNPVYR